MPRQDRDVRRKLFLGYLSSTKIAEIPIPSLNLQKSLKLDPYLSSAGCGINVCYGEINPALGIGNFVIVSLQGL